MSRLYLISGVALLPEDFPERLSALKTMSGLSWERMASAIGVDARQLYRWRRGTAPSGEGMLALARFATRIPGGLSVLLGEDDLDLAVVERG